MPQTSYALDLTPSVAGMLADNGPRDITSRAASEVIPAGRACVLDAGGTVSLPKTATGAMPSSGAGSLVGISVYTDAAPPGGYQIGDMVPLVRKGRVWADFTGTDATENELLQISHSSTIATDRGKFTDAAASTTTGTERTAFAKGIARGGNAGNTLALVEINLP